MKDPKEIIDDGIPLHVFPSEVSRFIKGFADGSGSQESYVALGVLACAAGMCDMSTLYVKDGYEEKCNLYLCIVGKPGVTKTAAIKAALKPLMKIQSKKNRKYKDALADWESKMKKAKKDEKEALQAQRPKAPACKVVSDGSIEGMLQHMEAQYDARKQPHCVYVRDELNGFFGGMNKYKSNGGDDNEMWLQMFSGQDVSKALVKKDIYIEDARATVIGGIQPEVYRGAMKDKGDGMIDRFMIALYEGDPKATQIRKSCPIEIIRSYQEHMDHVSGCKRKDYSFWRGPSDEREEMLDSVQEFHDWCHELGQTYDVGAFKKWEQCFYRLCIILGEIWLDDDLTLKTVERAKELAGYFAVNWIQTKEMGAETEEEILAKKILAMLDRKGARTGRQLCQDLHVKTAEIMSSIMLLEQDNKVVTEKEGRKVTYDLA